MVYFSLVVIVDSDDIMVVVVVVVVVVVGLGLWLLFIRGYCSWDETVTYHFGYDAHCSHFH